ncbi:MAG: LamG-like jellyroll fold domain-containing protein [archaeon]
MSYKRYIYINGKKYGPYTYKSVRQKDGSVKSQYIKPKSKKFDHPLLLLGIIILITIAIIFLQSSIPKTLTGQTVLDFKETVNIGETVSETYNLELQHGEFIPLDTQVKIKTSEKEELLLLSDFIDVYPSEGGFYTTDLELQGSGLGFGFPGTRENYPEVSFSVFLIYEINGTNETIEKNITISYENPYEIPENAVISYEELPEFVIIEENQIIYDYFEYSEGFGEEFLSEEIGTIPIEFELSFENPGEQEISLSLLYEEREFRLVTKTIEIIEEEPEEEIIEEVNETQEINDTIEEIINETIEKNITIELNISEEINKTIPINITNKTQLQELLPKIVLDKGSSINLDLQIFILDKSDFRTVIANNEINGEYINVNIKGTEIIIESKQFVGEKRILIFAEDIQTYIDLEVKKVENIEIETKKSYSIEEKPDLNIKLNGISGEVTTNLEFEHKEIKEDNIKIRIDNKEIKNQPSITGNFILDFFTITGNAITGFVTKQESNSDREIKPGLYKVKTQVYDKDLNTIYIQEEEFLWGVLAINTHKATYLPDETAEIAIAVLDNKGNMVCDADVSLEIKTPNGKTEILSTNNKKIQRGSGCYKKIPNVGPDYYASYKVGNSGTYKMILTASTKDGPREIQDAFYVEKSVDYNVQRNMPTRIYPVEDYNVEIIIKPNKNYNGQIIEKVPSSFKIYDTDAKVIENSKETQIIWNVDLKEETILTYKFDAPEIFPYLFVVGPLEIGNWEEKRTWKIASDAVIDIIKDYSFEYNNGTWTETNTNGGVANESNLTYYKGDSASGQTSTKDSTGTSTAKLSQTINRKITALNTTGSLDFWILWQNNATTGPKSCYSNFTSNVGNSLIYWYNLGQTQPSNTSTQKVLQVTYPTWQTWTRFTTNFWSDWNLSAGFKDTENVSSINLVCEGNYTAAACSGTLNCILFGADYTNCNGCTQCDVSGYRCNNAPGANCGVFNGNEAGCLASDTICDWFAGPDLCGTVGVCAQLQGDVPLLDECVNLETWGGGCTLVNGCVSPGGSCELCGSEEACDTQCGTAGCTWNAASTFGQDWFWDLIRLNATDVEVDIILPKPEVGTNPTEGFLYWESTINLDSICSDDKGVSAVQVWTNTTGTWHANYSNHSYVNDTWINVTISDMASGAYKWGVYCNDTTSNENWSIVNRTFSIDLDNSTLVDDCATLNKEKWVYTLSQNVTEGVGPCFTLAADNITLDCSGYWILTNSEIGIFSSGYRNLTIKNCYILQTNPNPSASGISLDTVGNSTIKNNKIVTLGTSSHGILLATIKNNKIINNIIDLAPMAIPANSAGIYLGSGSTDNNISFNNISTANGGGCWGVYITGAQNNTFVENIFYNNPIDIFSTPIIHSPNNFSRNKLNNSNTIISFDNYFISNEGGTQTFGIDGLDNPAADSGVYINISKYVNLTAVGAATTWINLTIHYNDTDWPLAGISDESTLTILRNASGTWGTITGAIVDTTNNWIYANISAFSDFGGFGDGSDANLPFPEHGEQPIPYHNSSENEVEFQLKCWDDTEVDFLILYGNWTGTGIGGIGVETGWGPKKVNETPINDTIWNITESNMGEGKYVWAVWCNDTSGNSNLSYNRSFTIDFKPKAYLGLNPIDNYNSSSDTIVFDLMCDDTTGDNLVLLTDITGAWAYNETNISPIDDTWWNISVVGIPDGTWKWSAYCNDSIGSESWNNTNRTFRVDARGVGPITSFGTNPVNDLNTFSNALDFEVKCEDNVKPSKIEIWLNHTGTWHLNVSNSSPLNDTIWTVSIADLPDGTHKWGVYCNDTTGNGDWTDTNRTFYKYTDTGRMILLLDKTDPIPENWTCMSCNTSMPFSGKFIRGEETYGGTGGANTHTHTFSTTMGYSSSGIGETGSGAERAFINHTHQIVTTNITSGDITPPYRQLNVIMYSYDGIPPQIPENAIAIFNTTDIPGGWTRYSAQDTFFVRGNSSASLTGGTTNHDHKLFMNFMEPALPIWPRNTGVDVSVSSVEHTHGNNSVMQRSTNVSHLPPHVEIILAKADDNNSIPINMIAMWTELPTFNWHHISNTTAGSQLYQKYIRANDTYNEDLGSATHTHSNISYNTQADNGVARASDAGANNLSAYGHTHQVNFTSISTKNNLPGYINVIFAYYDGRELNNPEAFRGKEPMNDYYTNNKSIVFDIKCTDDTSINAIEIWTNTSGTWHSNYSNFSYTNNTWLNITINGIIEGKGFVWDVRCNDTSGNDDWVGTNFTFNVDLTDPWINFSISTPDNASSISNDAIFINITSTDKYTHYTLVDFNEDLELWLRMDYINSSGDPIDNSTHNHNCNAIGNSRKNNTGYWGEAFQFDGSGDYIDCSNDASLQVTSNFSWGGWFNPRVRGTTTGDANGIISKLKVDGPGFSMATTFSGANTTGCYLHNGTYDETSFSDATISLNQWHMVICTYNGTHMLQYLDGVLQADREQINFTSIADSGQALVIGRFYSDSDAYYTNGTIDEVFLFDRVLTQAEINSLYSSTTTNYTQNHTGLAEATYNFTGYTVDRAGNENETGIRLVTISLTKQVWVNFENPTPANDTRKIANVEVINITANFTNNLDACVIQIENNNTGTKTNYSMIKSGAGTLIYCNYTLTSIDGWNYTYSVFVNDTSGNSNWTEIRYFEENEKPFVPNLWLPLNHNHTTNRTPEFAWNLSTDVEGDAITYQLNVTAICISADCDSSNNLLYNVSTLNYTLTQDQKLINLWSSGDYEDYYNWSLQMWDGYEWSASATVERQIYIDSEVLISLVTSAIDFNSMNNGETNDTTNDNPAPLVIENQGNCYVNLNVSSTDLLWDFVTAPSIYFRYKFANYSTQWQAFNQTDSQTTWADIPLANTTTLYEFNYTDGTDYVETDIYVLVPDNESAGAKTSNIVFTGYFIHDP